MENAKKKFWEKKLEHTAVALGKNGFEPYICSNTEEVTDLIFKKLLPQLQPKLISWGGSATLDKLGILQQLMKQNDYPILNTSYNPAISAEELLAIRKKAILANVFFSGSNAVTEKGELVNLDKLGNRVGAIVFGPDKVIIVAGRNKIVANIEQAMLRVKEISAPMNAQRFPIKTPCVVSGKCSDCHSADRICGVWTITQRSVPPKRIIVILVNEDVGY